MSSRRPLPVTSSAAARPPSVDEARRRLGGRAVSLPGVGEIVVTPAGVGVILFVETDTFDVWTGDGAGRRVPRGSCRALLDSPQDALAMIASDARVFASLQEGQPVRFSRSETASDDGVLVEKCRYGGLVERADGVVMGIGFQRLWPVLGEHGAH